MLYHFLSLFVNFFAQNTHLVRSVLTFSRFSLFTSSSRSFKAAPPPPRSLRHSIRFPEKKVIRLCDLTVLCLSSFWMELSREAYQLIIQYISSRSDLCALARTSKAFQRAAERALYNTLLMNDPALTINICNILASHPRLGALVDALTIFASPPADDDDDDDASKTSGNLPDGFWETVAAALTKTTRLRHFNIHVDGDTALAWILHDCKFSLESFHCDLTWDLDLSNFLNTQDHLRDLYLADYVAPPLDNSARDESGSGSLPLSSISARIHPGSLPMLSTLECSFIEAIQALVPGRPVVRIKTCFSRDDVRGKTEELRRLSASLRRASARVRSLDLGDASYTEEFSLTVLGALARHLPDLRYFGTLVLPVGVERLQFFGLLMRLRALYTVELEVSEWEPAPSPQAMRALASELRLYCPSIKCFVFVQEFERTIVRVINGFCTVDPDPNASTENLWREDRN